MRRARLVGGFRTVIRRGEHDARIPQAILLAAIAVDVAFWLLASVHPVGVAMLVGYALLAAGTVLATFLGSRHRPELVAAIPVLDMAAIGVLGVGHHAAIGVLLVVPAIWLAVLLGSRGVGLALGAILGALLIPALVFGADTVTTADEILQTLVVAGLGAGLVAAKRDQGREERRVKDAIVGAVDVGLLLLSPDGTTVALNPRQGEFERLAAPRGRPGEAPSAVFDRDAETPLDPEEWPTARARRREEFTGHLIWIGPPRNRRAISVSSRNLSEDAEESLGAVLAYHDVTDLVRALRAKEDFVASVSHELSTPLTSILGCLDVVQEDIEGVPVQALEMLSSATRGAERLTRVIASMLQLAHNVTLGMERQTVSFDEIVRQAVEIKQHDAVGAQIQLTSWIAGPVEVFGDQARLSQVVEQLIGNAIKYSCRGDNVHVSLTASQGDIRLSVQDTGMGIESDDHPALFERFFRTDSARQLAVPGIGLGLSMCKEIVEAHAGSIGVASQVGVGSMFEVTLPTAAKMQPAA